MSLVNSKVDRIAFLIQSAESIANYPLTQYILNSLVSNDHPVIIYTVIPGTQEFRSIPVKSVRRVHTGIALVTTLLRSLQLTIMLIRERGNYDVVHINMSCFYAFIVMIALRVTKRKVIITISEEPEISCQLEGSFKKNGLPKWLHTYVLATIMKATGFIVFPEPLAQFIVNYGIDRSRLIILDHTIYYSDPAAFEAQVRANPLVKPHVVVFGPITEQEHIDVIFKAAAKINSLHITVIGVGPALANLVSIAYTLGLSKRIVFTGTYKGNPLPDYGPKADLAILLNDIQLLPRYLVGLMRTGLPCIVVRSASTERIIEPGKTGLLVPQNDPQALAVAIMLLIENEDIRKIISKNTRHFDSNA